MRAKVVPFSPVLLDASGRPMGEGRGLGVHLSDVIRFMRITLGELDEAALANTPQGFAIGGWLFELWMGQALATYLSYSDANLIAPGECELDGILMNPDRLDIDDERLWEMKATHKTMKKLIDADGSINVEGLKKFFWYWLVQILAYCKVMGTRKARLVVNFVNGDYTFKPPFGGPQFVAIDFEFNQAEVEDNWKMVLVNAAAMRAA
jgi:hypothetical protein